MKNLIQKLFQFSIVILLFGSVLSTRAAFTSLYVFGDALSSTTDNPQVGPLYYGKRYSNGRVWVEVLAQRQGLTYNANKNNSYYDHNSSNLVTEIKNFSAPSDVTNDLFVLWVCNADTFDAASANDNSTQWTAVIKQSQANHLQIITNLYAKGVRTLILPNAVDISEIPAFNAGSLTSVMHNGCVAYDVAFSNTINQARALCPDLKIYAPNFFALLNNVLTNAAYYGLTNALANRYSIDAIDALYPACNTNGPGANYVFWDYMNPTAKFHAVIADVAQQIISPVQISQITAFTGSNRLDIANAPIGLNGLVESCTNLTLANWTTLTNFSSISTAQSLFAPTPASPTNTSSKFAPEPKDIAPGPGGTVVVTALQFYRLHFPYTWVWP